MSNHTAVPLHTLLMTMMLWAWPVASPAQDLRSAHFEGTVKSVDDLDGSFGGKIAVGDPVSGTFTYDLGTACDPIGSNFCAYEMSASLPYMVDIGGYEVYPAPAATWNLNVAAFPWPGTTPPYSNVWASNAIVSPTLSAGTWLSYFVLSPWLDPASAQTPLPDPYWRGTGVDGGRGYSLQRCLPGTYDGLDCSDGYFEPENRIDVDLRFVHPGNPILSASVRWSHDEPIDSRMPIRDPHSIDHPDNIVIVTPRCQGLGTPSVPCANPVGVSWDALDARWQVFNRNGSNLFDESAFNVLITPPNVQSFVHISDPTNIVANYTRIDHPLLNGRPDARLLVTQNPTPSGVSGYLADPNVLGVWYDGGQNKWAIFHENTSASMSADVPFNVHVLGAGPDVVVHEAAVGNSSGAASYLDHPGLNGRPDAIAFVTQVWNPPGSGATYNPHPVGLWYDATAGLWAVVNEDLAAMTEGADFFVYVPERPAHVAQHTSTLAGTIANFSNLDDERLASMLTPVLQETQRLNTVVGPAIPNPEARGVWFNEAGGTAGSTWSIYNEDDASSYPVDSVSILLDPALDARRFVHSATSDNTTIGFSTISHPLVDAKPDAKLFVTHSWNPASIVGTYVDGDSLVVYDEVTDRWKISNQGLFGFGAGVYFNVWVAPDDLAYTHVADAVSIVGSRTYLDDAPFVQQRWEQLLVTSATGGVAGATTRQGEVASGWDPVLEQWYIERLDGGQHARWRRLQRRVRARARPGGWHRKWAGIPVLAGTASAEL